MFTAEHNNFLFKQISLISQLAMFYSLPCFNHH